MNKTSYIQKTEAKENIVIPKGFYYVGGTLDSGIVISDNKEDENKGTDYNVSKQLKGNQFVWVPVNKCVAKHEYEIEESSFSNYPIALYGGNNNYSGILYQLAFKENRVPYFKRYSGREDNKNDSENMNREPAVLTMNIYGDSEEYIQQSTNNLYQNSFNKMVESVKKNNGFFVSRYEIGNLHGSVPVSKANESDISNMCWTDGYNQIKKMYDSSNVSAEMLWGCQYDAIMIWMYDSDSKEKYFVENTDSVCNRSKTIMPTANSENYSQKNIYDIIGNVAEFTQEAAYKSSRICRGGSYDYESTSSTNNMLVREQRGITGEYSNVGFRAFLIF